MKHININYDVIKETDFVNAVKQLDEGNCDAIYGPAGGILVLNKNNVLAYDANKNVGIHFSAKNYLGKWRLLLKK